jgi:precorrin-3B synthase
VRIGPDVAWQVAIGGTGESALTLATFNEEQALDATVCILAAIAERGREGRARDLDPEMIRSQVTGVKSDTPPSVLPDPALRYGSGRSSFEKPNRWLFAAFGDHSSPPSRGEISFRDDLRQSSTLQKVRGERGRPISPLEGEMSGRTEGGEEQGAGASERDAAQTPQPIGIFDLADGRAVLGVGLPFGQIEASRLAGFCRLAGDTGVAEIRLAPGRAILLLAEASACLALQAVAPRHGLIVDPADARLGIAACPGSPACASGHIAARAIAEQLAALGHGLFDRSLSVHVSGCVKGCAHPGPADLTFVGHADGVDLVVGGNVSGMSEVRLEHAEIRHGFARLAGLYRDKRQSGESTAACFSRLGASRVAADFRGQS